MNIFYPKVKKTGELDFGNRDTNIAWILFCKNNDGKRIKIGKEEPKRTLSQNAFYWLYLGMIADQTGNDQDALHELFKIKFLKKQLMSIKTRKGQVYHISTYPSTTKLKKHEFGEYLDKISALSGVPIPDPKRNGFIMNY